MKKKILCAIMSAVMVVGTLVGCGSSSSNPSSDTADKDNDKSSKVEQTILTELIPGETTAEETKKWFQDNGLATETNGNWQPAFADNEIPYLSKSSDTFLGYKCFYVRFDYVGTDGAKEYYEAGLDDETLSSYKVCVTFKDREDYKAGKEKIEEYIKSLSSTKAVQVGRDGNVEDSTILIKDKDKYATMIISDVKDLTWISNNYCKGLDMSDCFDTVLCISYQTHVELSDWILPDGTKFDLKCKDFVQSNQP